MGESQLLPFIVAGVAFLSVLLAGVGIIGYLGGTDQTARLKGSISGTRVKRSDSLTAPLASSFQSVIAFFGRLGSKIGPQEEVEIDKNRLSLIQAGLRKPDSYKIFQGIKGCMAIGTGVVFLLVRPIFFPDISVIVVIFGTLAMATIGLYGPEYWLTKRVARRKTTISDELPDALDLLVVCVESGMGLDQAIDRVCEEVKTSGPIISSELKILTLELRAGKGRTAALRALSERVGLDDLNSLTSLLIQADAFGISIGRTLRVYSDAMRTKRSQRAEETAAKMPVLLLLPLVCCILPALFITIMGPAVMLFIDTFALIGK
ncbi:MAG: type II secretion system F family protein [Pseudodesulfovibrio sp.]|nr:type II secretion system F family protein [Pseudodesulfovibrio sp.]